MSPFDLEKKEKEIEEMERESARPDFWDDPINAQKVMRKITDIRDKLDSYYELKKRFEDAYAVWEMGLEEGEESLFEDLSEEIKEIDRKLKEMEIEVLLNGPYDKNDAIISLHAGAGGTEAQDWVDMLFRMYSRWVEKKGMRLEIVDHLPGEEAGTKSLTAVVKGDYAYGYLKAERGVHRLVRISPFDASGRRHTSFASVEVIPEIEEDDEIEINPSDLRIDTFRAGGAGGQHVNKTDSAVRITHLPTGIVVQCQNERSQHANRLAALKILRARLFELKRQERERKLAEQRGEQPEIGWGNQIRSYVFQPYTLVKDHRTNFEMGNIESVMDGNIDPFIMAYLKHKASKN
ncbi:MAG: Peptide chain release factor 2 [Clostridia bacterium 41_269]|nr:MAG: Peptide chain release factor 2 [Clostridia bacterium 41_269]